MARAVTARRPSLKERFRGVSEILTEVRGQLMGKIGLGLIVFFVVVSIFALLTIPWDFYIEWNDRKLWEEYPEVVPPVWVSHFGVPVAQHVSKIMSEPTETMLYKRPKDYNGITLFGYTTIYRLRYRLKDPAFPQGILIMFEDVAINNFTYRGKLIRPDSISVGVHVLLHRPDGKVLLINEPTPRSLTEIASAKTVRFDDAYVANQILAMYPGTNMTKDYATSNAVKLAFGVYEDGVIKPLRGTYEVELIVTYLARGVSLEALKNVIEAGEIGVREVKMVIEGSAYGLMGTDSYGRDIYRALLYSFPVELVIGFIAAVAAVVIGLMMGVISGYYGGWVDEIIQRVIDIMGAIPALPILILVGAALQERGASPWMMLFVIIAFLIIFGWGGLAIIVRSMTLSIKSEPYVDAAKTLGASNIYIIFKHIIPQIVPYAMASLVFSVPAAVLTEAGLSVLGIRHNLPTWGTVLADARDYVYAGGSYGVWWWILPPGILMGLMSVAFVFLGLALETIVEPRLRRR